MVKSDPWKKIEVKDRKEMFEKFVKDSGETRYNEHKLHMPRQKDILSIAKSKGFKLYKIIDLVNVQYEYQYLYIQISLLLYCFRLRGKGPWAANTLRSQRLAIQIKSTINR